MYLETALQKMYTADFFFFFFFFLIYEEKNETPDYYPAQPTIYAIRIDPVCMGKFTIRLPWGTLLVLALLQVLANKLYKTYREKIFNTW